MAIITLLTDFGTRDEYAGILKGVIYGINPAAAIVDLTHAIPPQDVVRAALVLKAAWRYFPAGTIHTAVVDPGVGSGRPIIAARQNGHWFLAPDNGLLSAVWQEGAPERLVRVENQALFLQPVSRTFHGRDIFAPVAAHLSLGMAVEELGSAVHSDEVIRLDLAEPRWIDPDTVVGRIVSVDHFGNLVTNLGAAQMDRLDRSGDGSGVCITVGAHCIQGLSSSYAQKPPGKLMAVIGSREVLEIAVNQGSAAQYVGVGAGDTVQATSGLAGKL